MIDYKLPRRLTKEEAKLLLNDLVQIAETTNKIELSDETWNAYINNNIDIITPIGPVKLGEHQKLKLEAEGRNTKLAMILPTLTRPNLIIQETSKRKDGNTAERGYSNIFVKSFVNTKGDRYYFFTSVTVKLDTKEVSVSNQEKKPNRIVRLLTQGTLAYISMATLPSESVTSAQGNEGCTPNGAL